MALNPTRGRAIEELRRMVLSALGEHDAAVWLFGSFARGEPRQHSDIGAAVRRWLEALQRRAATE
jgi:predicted nucleotidyltransferase